MLQQNSESPFPSRSDLAPDGIGQEHRTGISWTGTTSKAEAEALLEAIRAIMEETGLPFGPAVDIYIGRRANGVDSNTNSCNGASNDAGEISD